jgi:acetyl-CoA carboxylase alpha subunit
MIQETRKATSKRQKVKHLTTIISIDEREEEEKNKKREDFDFTQKQSERTHQERNKTKDIIPMCMCEMLFKITSTFFNYCLYFNSIVPFKNE